MDTHVKEGQLYVQHQKFGKKWKKNWFVLYPASQNGIARLEFFDCNNASEKPNTKKLDKKIIRLAECISILPAVTEVCPKENMAAFCVETNDKTHVFAAEKQACAEWVEKMCEIAFQKGSGSDSNGQQELKMAENLIYYSREEVNEFWVTAQRTEASERCSLQGTYWLKADSDSLVLKDPNSKRTLLLWPYKLLRRYGRDKVMFSFEAGRRCESGPGNFTFETKQGNEIFGIVEAAIREQKAQAEERHQSCPSLDLDCAPLQPNRSPTSDGGGDADGDSGGSKPGSADGVIGRREGEAKNLKSRILPEPPPAVTNTPPRSPLPRGPRSTPQQDDPSSLYSEPADSVRLPLSSVDYLYSDPVDSIKTPTPAPRVRPQVEDCPRTQGNRQEPLYSGIYDRVDLTQRMGALALEGRSRNGVRQVEGAATVEHIYDEPEGRGAPQGPTLYDEARLELHAWKNRGQEEPSLGHEVPYNPQTDDYSVPAYSKQPQVRSKGPKPLPAPKPNKMVPRKEPPPLPQGKASGNMNNNNSRNGGKHSDLYSHISKHKSPVSVHGYSNVNPADIIYDNLGDI